MKTKTICKKIKKVGILFLLVMLFSNSIFVTAEDSKKSYGDVDASGEIDANDALGILKYVAKLAVFDEQQEKVADVNGDTVIDAVDALNILKYVAKMIDKFPVEEGIKLIVSSVDVSPGDKKVEVVVSVENNPGILGMLLTIEYDESVMTLTNAASGEAVSDILTFTKANQLKSGCNFVWDGQEITDKDVKDGAILILTFDIKKEASAGSYEIDFLYGDGNIIDRDLNPVVLDVEAGDIHIK